jgi:23S rRNA (pseudouridine1915-N3)-methyltransferase
MRATLVCVGRLARHYQPVWLHYADLLRPYVQLEVLETPEAPRSFASELARSRESRALLSLLRADAFSIAVDLRGREYSSENWSEFLASKKLHGVSHFQFILGGAVGLDRSVLTAAQAQWSLSALTFPHQMARCIVLEQLYRALKIERGEPYHY